MSPLSREGETSVWSWCCGRCSISCLSESSPLTSQGAVESPGQAEEAAGGVGRLGGPATTGTGAGPSSSSAGSPAEPRSRHSSECSGPRSLSGGRRISSSGTGLRKTRTWGRRRSSETCQRLKPISYTAIAIYGVMIV